jgi:pre-mRNA-processing factor 17
MPPKGSVPTGYASEIAISGSTFKSHHRALQTGSTPNALTVAGQKRKREGKGDSSVVFGDNSYKGPWAKFREKTPEEEGSGSEIEVTDYSEEEEDGTTKALPKLVSDYAPEGQQETTEFHGESLYDYQGRTYMHVPQDLDINLTYVSHLTRPIQA